jgi:hypothetical protein
LIGWNRKRKGKRLGKGGDFGAQELNVREGREGRVNRYNGDSGGYIKTLLTGSSLTYSRGKSAAAVYVIETYDGGLRIPRRGTGPVSTELHD